MTAVLIAALPLASIAGPDLQRGDAAYTRCDLPKAIEAYRAARAADTNSCEAAWKLARAINDQGFLMKRSPEQKKLLLEAQALAQEATRLDPKESKGFCYLAIASGKVALFEGGKKKIELGKSAKSNAEKAIELNKDEDLAYHVLGVWNREMATLNAFLRTFAEWIYGKFPDASLAASADNFRQAIKLNDTSIAHHTELGITHQTMKKWADARSEFERALALPKQYPPDETYQQQARAALKQLKNR